MSILFNKPIKAQNGLPTNGQLSPSGKAKFINDQWVGVPVQDRGKVEDVYGIATQVPGVGLNMFDEKLGKMEQKDISTTAKLNSSLIGAFKPQGGAFIQAGDTTYTAKALPENMHYEIPYQGSDTKKSFDIKLKSTDKGSVLGSVHSMKDNDKNIYRSRSTVN